MKKAATAARPAAKTTKKAAAPAKTGAVKDETTAKRAAKKAASSRGQAKPAAEKASAAKTARPPKARADAGPSKAAAKKAPTKKAPTRKAAAKKAPAKKSPYGAKFLAAQEAALRHERATYFRQFESLLAEADALVADFESGDVQFDEESGEGDTINIERERDLALSAQARQAVEEIDHALTKIKAGTYGLCETSGDPIPKDRLEAIPWARERVEYKIGGFGRR